MLEGPSAMQFIETSSITIHADETAGRCFIDVFSCREFDPDAAAEIAVAHFDGRPTLRVGRVPPDHVVERDELDRAAAPQERGPEPSRREAATNAPAPDGA
jgi:hypothetical protein